MRVNYDQHYGADYWTGRKTYRAPNGRTEVYHGPSLEWSGFDFIADALAAVLPKGTLLDIGCGSGDLARRLMHRGFDPYGVDISEYAVEHAATDMHPRLQRADVTQAPKLYAHFPQSFQAVIATDFLEHIYEADLEQTFNWILEQTERWLFFCVATAPRSQEFIAKKGEPIPPQHEGTAVSGHVNVRNFSYWVRFFESRERVIKIDWRRMYLFQMRRESVPAWRDTGGWAMTNTFILECF